MSEDNKQRLKNYQKNYRETRKSGEFSRIALNLIMKRMHVCRCAINENLKIR